MYSSSPSPPSHDCSPRPVRPGGRACAHAWPAPRTLSPFLSAEAAAAPRARLGPSGDLPPSERGGPERLRSLLSAAGGRVATFVNCKQTHVVLQQSRPCLVLVASPPRFLLPPPAAASFLSLLHRSLWAPPLQGRLGGPCRAWGQGARGYNAAMPRLRARGAAAALSRGDSARQPRNTRTENSRLHPVPSPPRTPHPWPGPPRAPSPPLSSSGETQRRIKKWP